MNLKEIEEKLPNGFHDAILKSINIDYQRKEATLCLDISTGYPDGLTPEERDSYKKGELKITGLHFFIINEPHPGYILKDDGKLMIDMEEIVLGDVEPSIDDLLKTLPVNAFAYRIYLNQLNSYIYLAATDSILTWDEEIQ